MRDVERVIEVLLATSPGGFRNKHLATALGVSRARASQLLAARVVSGELEKTKDPRARYIRGPNWGNDPEGVARGAWELGFWRRLVEKCPGLAYLALEKLAPSGLRTRRQVRAVVRGLVDHHELLIVDFEGVLSISPAACDELLVETRRYWGMGVEPINASLAVARTIRRVLRSDRFQLEYG